MANLELSFPGVAAAPGLSVRHFDIVEGLSTPFEAMLVAASSDPDLDFDLVLGKPARCRIDGGPLGTRTWTGVCSSIEQTETEPDGATLYVVRVVPRLWLLSQRRGQRLFQHLSTPAIARALLAEWGIEATLRLDEPSFPRHELRVQYGESNLSFLHRLLEDAGVSYFFEQRAAQGGGEVESHLVLSDAVERGEPRASGPIPFVGESSTAGANARVTDVRFDRRVRPGVVVLGDFDFRKPLYEPTYRAVSAGPGEALLEHQVYAPGAALIDTDTAPSEVSDTPVADADGRARTDDREGNALAARTLAGLREGSRTLAFTTNLVDLAPGDVFSIDGAPRPELAPDQRLCVVRTSLEGRVAGAWKISAVAEPCDAPVRTARRTERPRLVGVQSALVVGPPGEEIQVDELGRVRVRFHWDREAALHDAHAPWVRVAEGWAGAGWGMTALPRAGNEVLVAFFEGDPDQPVVVGRVHDAASPPPHVLPGGRAKSAWRSRSSPTSGGYQEIAFDDRSRHELLSIHAERNLEKVVKRDEVETTGHNRSAAIGRHLATTVGAEDTLTVGAMHTVSMAGAGATRSEIVAKRITLSTGSSTIMLDGPDILITGKQGISIKAGGTVSIQGESYVHLNPPGEASAAVASAAEVPDHLVWFRLVSEGKPLAGARCHVEREGGDTSAAQTTDGNGMVRFPVDEPGTYHIMLGTPPAKAPVKAPAPKSAPAPVSPVAPIHVGQTPAQPSKRAQPTEHEVPIKLEIVEPKHGSTFDLLYTPAMPTIPLEARVLVQGVPTHLGSVRWELYLSGSYRVRDEAGSGYVLQEYKLPAGHARTSPGAPVKLELAPAQLTGGELEIKAVFDGGAELGGATASRSVTGCKVIGKDPPRSEVEAYIAELGGSLSWLYLRMFCFESLHQLAQFARQSGGGNTPGFPLYGPPSGVGIVQRDPTAGEWSFPKGKITHTNNFFPRIFWDWKKNVVEGISSFHGDYIERGRRDLDLLRQSHPHLPMYPQGVLMRAAIRRYNGGTEFAASSDGRHYVVQPAYTNNPGYVDNVLGDPDIDATKYPVPHDARAKIWPG